MFQHGLEGLTAPYERLLAHRANTYPFTHSGIISALLNICAFTPLVQRFETQNGTLATLALFFGRELTLNHDDDDGITFCAPDFNYLAAFSTFPAFLYVLIDRLVFHTNAALMGAR